MDKLCGLYVRVSTERQSEVKDGSLDTQIDRLKQYVEFRRPTTDEKAKKKQDDWKVIDVYREGGKSGKNIERPELQRLISDIKAGVVNTVVCTKIDRITRSLIDFYKLIEIFSKYNIDFISLQESFDTSQPMGKAMLKMTLVWAELEREQTSLRTREKMQWRAEQGLWNGGQVLGYDLKDKNLIVNPQEARLVELIFRKYLELGSVLQVVEYLNSHGYRTKEFVSKRKNQKHGGGKFFNAYILQKLKTRLYLGETEHNGKIFPGKHKAIINRQLWEEVNKLISKNAPKRINPKRETQHVFLLSSLLKCGSCGSYLTTKYCTGRNGLHYYYQCTRNSHGGKSACDMKYVPAPELEKVILEKLKEMSTDPNLIKKIVREANKATETTLNELKREKRIQENKLLPIKEAIKNIVHAVSQGKGLEKSKSMTQELSELEEQKEQIEKDLNTIDFELNQVKQQVLNARIMHESLTKFSQIYETATPLELKELLPRFVEKITWKSSEIEIALFDQEHQRGQLPSATPSGNHPGGGAPEVTNWLPKRDVKRTLQPQVIQLLESLYKRHGRHTLISIGEKLPGIKLPPRPVYRNIVKEALRIKTFLNEDRERSYSNAGQRFNVSRSRISQLMKIIENIPEDFIIKLSESDDQNLLKRFSGKVLYRITQLEQKEQRAFIKQLTESSSADLVRADNPF